MHNPPYPVLPTKTHPWVPGHSCLLLIPVQYLSSLPVALQADVVPAPRRYVSECTTHSGKVNKVKTVVQRPPQEKKIKEKKKAVAGSHEIGCGNGFWQSAVLNDAGQ